MTILVTGSTGFIGNEIISELLKYNHTIIATGKDPDKAKNFHWFNKVKYISYNLNERKKHLCDLFLKPDLLIHTAWDHLPEYNNSDYSKENFENSFHFIDNMIRSGVKNIAVTGTCFEYGLKEGSLNENSLTLPATEYGKAKLQLLESIKKLNCSIDFNYKWIRLFYIYGKNDSKRSIITQLEDALKNKDEYFNMSKGDQVRDYLPVEKACEYIVKISLQDQVNGIINCSSGQPVTVEEFIIDYLKTNKKEIKLNLGVHPYNKHEPQKCWGDNEKLTQILKLYK